MTKNTATKASSSQMAIATNHDALTVEQQTAHFEAFAPRYMSSLDDALTLVPEGLAIDICAYSGGKGDARVWGGERGEVWGSATHVTNNRPATPAIAVCIAALKARRSK
jgi:hypothetical protein